MIPEFGAFERDEPSRAVVRCLLVPAVMVLLGKRAWWLPRWMEKAIPHVSIEGEEYFAKRDAEKAASTPTPAPAGGK